MSRSARAGLLVVWVAALTLAGCGSIGPGRSASGKTASKQLNTAGVTRLERLRRLPPCTLRHRRHPHGGCLRRQRP